MGYNAPPSEEEIINAGDSAKNRYCPPLPNPLVQSFEQNKSTESQRAFISPYMKCFHYLVECWGGVCVSTNASGDGSEWATTLPVSFERALRVHLVRDSLTAVR